MNEEAVIKLWQNKIDDSLDYYTGEEHAAGRVNNSSCIAQSYQVHNTQGYACSLQN